MSTQDPADAEVTYERLLTVKDVAERLAVSRTKVFSLIKT